MHDEEIRNSLISSLIGEHIQNSELLDTSLNPTQRYLELRQLLNDPRNKKLMKLLQKQPKNIKIYDTQKKSQLVELHKLIIALSDRFDELADAIPQKERNTQLDILCQTKNDLVNVEVQVVPQNFWDIRIMAHACGLFYRQFPKGFSWSNLEGNNSNIKRVIGISILETPPSKPNQVPLPWYQPSPWKQNELTRHFRFTEAKNSSKIRPGIEFFDYNLAALQYTLPKKQSLKDWLELLAKAHMQTKKTANSVITPDVKKAYNMIQSSTLPEDTKKAYAEEMKNRLNISHHIDSQKTEGQLEILKDLIKSGSLDLKKTLNDHAIPEKIKQELKQIFKK